MTLSLSFSLLIQLNAENQTRAKQAHIKRKKIHVQNSIVNLSLSLYNKILLIPPSHPHSTFQSLCLYASLSLSSHRTLYPTISSSIDHCVSAHLVSPTDSFAPSVCRPSCCRHCEALHAAGYHGDRSISPAVHIQEEREGWVFFFFFSNRNHVCLCVSLAKTSWCVCVHVCVSTYQCVYILTTCMYAYICVLTSNMCFLKKMNCCHQLSGIVL